MTGYLAESITPRGSLIPRFSRTSMIPGILVLATTILLGSCGANELEPLDIRVTLTPSTASVHLMLSVQFAATVHNSTNSTVTWSLSGAGCSGASCGTISSTGLYTGPVSVPNPAIVTVRATSVADVSRSASATITILEGVNAWTWVSGSNLVNEQGTYGTKGVPSTTNIPRSRYSAVSWIDPQGKLWLFGGDSPGFLNDLWMFDPTTLEWTWVSGKELTPDSPGSAYGAYGTKGVPSPSNVPGARCHAVSWIDTQGILWLFGGAGYASPGSMGGCLNDLWKFDPAALEWTWVSGSDLADQAGIYGTKGTSDPSNVPGARAYAISWTDSGGKLWLFGGNCYNSRNEISCLNDLWRFDPATLEWTWMSGSDQLDQPAVYGTKGFPSSSNVPGARYNGVSWIDLQGKLWHFGGTGFNSTADIITFNDLWKYDPATSEWTWVSGADVPDQEGVYGTMGTPSSSNIPGARSGSVSWKDSQGKLWLFGGGSVNDLWRFDPATLEWTWMSGSDVPGDLAHYGTKGVIDSVNLPGVRSRAISWIDAQDRLWLFGGDGYIETNISGRLNDLWQFRQ
jgi:hypothetical protein